MALMIQFTDCEPEVVQTDGPRGEAQVIVLVDPATGIQVHCLLSPSRSARLVNRLTETLQLKQ